MKKYFLLFIVLLSVYPTLNSKGKLQLSSSSAAYASGFVDEWDTGTGGGGDGSGDGDGDYYEPGQGDVSMGDYLSDFPSSSYNSSADYTVSQSQVTINSNSVDINLGYDNQFLDALANQPALLPQGTLLENVVINGVPIYQFSTTYTDPLDIQLVLTWLNSFNQQVPGANPTQSGAPPLPLVDPTVPCNVKSAVSKYLQTQFPPGTSASTVSSNTSSVKALGLLDQEFFSNFPLPGTLKLSTQIPPQTPPITIGANGGWANVYNASTGTYGPATAVTATTGTGVNAQSIIYVSPTVFTTGYNPDAMIAELAHELIHAYLDQNNITGVDEDYLAWSYQADVYKAQAKTMNTSDDDYAKYLQYSAAAQSAANQPGFNNSTNATALSHLPSVPTNVTPCQ